MLKKLLFIALALAAVQEIVMFEDTVDYAKYSAYLFDQISKGCEDLKKIVANELKPSINEFEQYFSKLLDMVSDNATEASTTLNKTAEDALESIRSIIDDASTSGINVSKCIFGKNEQILNIPINSIKQSNDHANGSLNGVSIIIAKSSKGVQDKIKFMNNYEQDAQECNSEDNYYCLSEALAKYPIYPTLIRLNLESLSMSVKVDTLDYYKSSIQNYYAESIAKAKVQIASIVDEVKRCVQKMGHTNSPSIM